MSCTYFFVPFLYLLFSHHLCTPFVFYTTGPCRAFFTRHRNQFGESSFVCGLCVLVNVVHICDCVCGFSSLNTDKKTFVYINWQIKMKTHQWNFDSVNTSHSQRGGRWKYLVLGGFWTPCRSERVHSSCSHGIKRDICINKRAKVNRRA